MSHGSRSEAKRKGAKGHKGAKMQSLSWKNVICFLIDPLYGAVATPGSPYCLPGFQGEQAGIRGGNREAIGRIRGDNREGIERIREMCRIKIALHLIGSSLIRFIQKKEKLSLRLCFLMPLCVKHILLLTYPIQFSSFRNRIQSTVLPLCYIAESFSFIC